MSITFTNFRNPAWEDKIEVELATQLESRTRLHVIQPQGIYCFYETQHIGGVIFAKHGDILWLDGLFIIPAFRRQGIGRKLIEKAIDFAQEHQIKQLQLNTYFEEANAFFEACEFKTITSIPNWKYGLTCYLMAKTL